MNKNREFKENERLVRYYFRLRNRRTAIGSMNDSGDDPIATVVDGILKMMNEDERVILENEYIKDYPRNWWQNYYSKSRYYRIKSKALRSFIRLTRW